MKNPNKHYYKSILAFIVGFLYSISGVAQCQTLKAIKIPVISDAVPAVGINTQLSALNFQLTPNPATVSVTVVDSRSGTPLRYVKEIQVISPLGQTLLHLRGTNRFNVSTLPAATYLVKGQRPLTLQPISFFSIITIVRYHGYTYQKNNIVPFSPASLHGMAYSSGSGG